MTEWELGIQAFRQGRLREASDRLRAAADDKERTVTQTVRFQTLAYLGAALYALGRAEEAVEALEQAIHFSPRAGTPSDLRINLSNAYLAAGRADDARRVLQETLQETPGSMEARMLLERLGQRDPATPLTGSALGVSPASVLRYMHTLSFGTVTAGGLDPAQVRLALTQIERHVEFLVRQIVTRDETIARLEAELEIARPPLLPLQTPEPTDGPPLTPLEALLRQKPRKP
jgi:tetratricopeptide (TPR) repeat protein